MFKNHGSVPLLILTAATLSFSGSSAGFGLPDIGDVPEIELPNEVTRVTLLPSQVHSGFSSLDESNPFELDSLTYLHTEMNAYDEFFFQASRMRGAVELAHSTVEMVQSVTDTEMLAKAMADEDFLDTIEDTEQYETCTTLRIFIPATVEGLSALPEEVAGLSATAADLAASAPSDFAGVNAVHLPDILTELADTADFLTGLPSEAELLLSELRAAVPSMEI